MSENCNHDCSSCGEACASRDPKSFLEKPHAESSIRKVIGVVSGKGGVGKSMVSSLLASNFQKKGYHTAVMDADITGPSIPKAYGINEKATGDEHAIYPVISKSGIQVMSVNLLLEDATDPVIWRGPVIAGTVKQFWQDVVWKDVDYMFVDMPPGTGDRHCNLPTGTCIYDRRKSCQNGTNDEYSDHWYHRKYELRGMSGLWQSNRNFRQKSC